MQEGDPGDSLYVILSGSVRSFSSDWDGKEITYGIYSSGEMIGEMSLDGDVRSASVIAIEDCECTVIGFEPLKVFLSKDPSAALALVTVAIRRAREATHAAKSLALLDVYGRLRDFLNSAPLSTPAKNDRGRTLQKFSQKDIAQRIGSSREMVSRLFRDLELGGYIEVPRAS